MNKFILIGLLLLPFAVKSMEEELKDIPPRRRNVDTVELTRSSLNNMTESQGEPLENAVASARSSRSSSPTLSVASSHVSSASDNSQKSKASSKASKGSASSKAKSERNKKIKGDDSKKRLLSENEDDHENESDIAPMKDLESFEEHGAFAPPHDIELQDLSSDREKASASSYESSASNLSLTITNPILQITPRSQRDEVIEEPRSVSLSAVTSLAASVNSSTSPQALIQASGSSAENVEPQSWWQRVKGTFVKNKKEYVEGAVLTGFMTFFGWYGGGNEGDYNFPEIVNAFAGLAGGNIADMVEMQSFISKFIKIGVPMTIAYVINHFGFQDINPYAGNTFFFALCFAAMLELKLMSARIKGVPAELKTRYIPLQRKLVDLLGYKENDSIQEKAKKIAIAQRIIQAAEFAVLAGSATGLGVAVEKMSGALGAAAYAFASLPTFFVGIASGNVGGMSEGLAYWKRSLWLLPAATATWAINQFALDGARPEIPYMLLFAWVGLTFKEIKQKIGLEEEKHSEGPRGAASVIR